MTKTFITALFGATALTAFGPAQVAYAAEAAPAASDSDAGSDSVIIVTARKRNESLVDVPLAISVVNSEKLERLNITNTNDLSKYVPGLEFNDFTPGNSRNDRGSQRLLIFRGLNLSNNGGITGAGSTFLDGAAVIGNEVVGGMDIGAVEVLRGPQSVYFGRASMTGAVSYRTKAIPSTLTGQVEFMIAQRETYKAEASVAGPLIPDLIGFRVTGLAEGNDGYICNDWDNCASKLGARKRHSVSGTLEFTPAPTIKAKLYANYFEDEDGMAATVNIFPSPAVTNCMPGTRPNICGQVPGPQFATNYSNLIIPAREAAALFNIPFQRNDGFNVQPGLQRKVFNAHGVVDIDMTDWLRLESITGYHIDSLNNVGDGIQQPANATALYGAYFYNLPNKYRDFSQEFRLTTDSKKPLSFTFGVNYINARNQSTAVVTFVSTNQKSFVNGNTNVAGIYLPFPQNIGDDRAKTYGVFGGGYLKLLDDKLTLSAEGRYQVDKRQTFTFNPAGTQLSAPKADFKSFNPRLSADFEVGQGRKVYASYATGSRPGGFNAGLLVYFNPANDLYTRAVNPLNYTKVTNSITSVFGLTDPAYKEEKLRIGELGFKGNFAGNRGYFDINLYYGKLKNQQIRQSLSVPELGFSLAAVSNAGSTELYGVEFQGNYNFTPELSLSTSFAYNHTKRLTYIDNAPATFFQFGRNDFSGLKLANTPEITGSAVLSYEGKAPDTTNPFGTIAFVYRGKQFADLGNLAYIPGRATVDLRLGVKTKDNLKLEGFVTNLFNNLTYPGGNVAQDFGGSAQPYYGFFGAYAVPRTVGARLSASF